MLRRKAVRSSLRSYWQVYLMTDALKNLFQEAFHGKAPRCTRIYLAPVLVLLCCISCAKERSVTDLVFVTKPDEYLTAADIKDGARKTGTIAGRVSLSHEIHESKGIACAACHHKKDNDERVKTCAWCHKGVSGRKVLHAQCIQCHEKDGGPIKCDECHLQGSVSGISGSDGETGVGKAVFDKKNHQSHKEAGIECDGCHHAAFNSKKIKECRMCHAGMIGTKLFHTSCLKCHRDMGAGPLKCVECHKGAVK